MAGEGLRGKSELTQRVISAAILAALAFLVAWLGGWPFAVVWGLLAVAVAYEWARIVAPAKAQLFAGLIAIFAAALVFSVQAGPWPALLTLALAGAVGFAIALPGARGWLMTGAIYALLLVGATVLLRGQGPLGFAAICYMFAVVWLTDIGAYFAGRTFGGPKFAPRISPKKTWSGVVGGLVSGMLGAALIVMLAGLPLRPAHLLIAFILGVTVVFGDLFESFLKRRFGVKDAGSLIPGHGGFLDRLDGFAAAIVVAAVIGAVRGGWGRAAEGLLAW